MSDINDFLDLMPDTVIVQTFLNRDAYGNPSYASPRSYRARVNYKQHFIRVSESEQVVARGMCWLATSDAITVNDKISLPDGTEPLILDANLETDENGPLYVRLDFA